MKILLAVVGPTGIGKTFWAIQLAKHFNTEILSADSRQFYKEMSIGTAVPSENELKTIKHHFIQHKSIFEPYSVGEFEKDAIALLNELYNTYDIAILAGGSGLYIDAIVKGLDDFPEVTPQIREDLVRQWQSEGIESLQQELKDKDPAYYQTIDLENPHRLIRALEIIKVSGKPYSYFRGKKKSNRNFKTIYVGIEAAREIIYQRIEKRVDIMISEGLLAEAKSLWKHKELNALQTVGYKELFEHFEGETSLERAISEIKKNTRRYAKRQLTWYRKNEAVFWIDFDAQKTNVFKKIEQLIETRNNDS
jgi:tRNA dimethylallyltransferase